MVGATEIHFLKKNGPNKSRKTLDRNIKEAQKTDVLSTHVMRGDEVHHLGTVMDGKYSIGRPKEKGQMREHNGLILCYTLSCTICPISHLCDSDSHCYKLKIN